MLIIKEIHPPTSSVADRKFLILLFFKGLIVISRIGNKYILIHMVTKIGIFGYFRPSSVSTHFLPGGSRWRDGEPIVIDGYKVQTGGYALSSGGRAKAMTVNHPSVGYSGGLEDGPCD